MDGKVKSNRYLTDQPASVHTYANLENSDSPRTHASPTSILRKYPHSLRHDQKYQEKIKRYSSPITSVVRREPVKSVEKSDRDVKSWCLGDGEEMENAFEESVMKASRLSDSVCKAFEYVTGNHSPIDEEKSECGVSSASEKNVSDKGLVLKLQSNSVNININDCKSVHNFIGKPENGNSPGEDVVLSCSRVDDDFTESELQRSKQQRDRFKIGSLKKLSVINNSLSDYKNVDKKYRYNNIDKLSELNKRVKSPVHKSTPNLLPNEGFGVRSSVSHPGHITDRLNRIEYVNSKETLRSDCRRDGNPILRNQQVSLKGSDSLPQLNQRNKFIHSLLPKLNKTISESGDKLNFSKGYIKSDTQINSSLLFGAGNRSDSYQLLSNSLEIYPTQGRKPARSEDGSESIGPFENRSSMVVRTQDDKHDVKNRWSRRKPTEIMPSLKNLMTRKHRRGIAVGKKESDGTPPSVSVPLVTTNPPAHTSRSFGNLTSSVIRNTESDDESLTLKKSGTMYSLTNFSRTNSTLLLQPVKPINRLRVPPNGLPGSSSRICSRCSSLLSMASSSRYSINTTGSGFIPCSTTSGKAPEPNMVCKLCLSEVPLSQWMTIGQCGCVFCRDCMRQYVEHEIQEGSYDISCPDARCQKQGIMTINECEQLVSVQMMERHMRFRLNHEIDLDKDRTWCPSAGCETVCNICPREECSPTSVHCPTCDSDFCSNCKNPWHVELTCEENSRKLAKEGNADFMESGIPFDSELIKCCPMCNVPIEKDEGCAQMMCKKCKHVFCWYCLASLDDDFLLRHYDKGPCKNKLGHSRASVIWHRTQVIGIFAGFGILLLIASPLLLIAAPCVVCCKCRVCSGSKMDSDEDLQDDSGT